MLWQSNGVKCPTTKSNRVTMKTKEVKKLSDMQLIFYVQDFNKPEREDFYTEDFRKAVHDEICKRGDETQTTL